MRFRIKLIFIGKLSVLEPVSSTMYDIKGKNVFITAAGKGIGRGVTEVLASQGCNIFLTSRNMAELNEVSELLKNRYGVRIESRMADLSSSSDLEEAFQAARKAFGNIDFLIINYGDPKVDRFIDISTEDWEYSINMILRSTILLSGIFLRQRLKGSRIVYITSMTTKMAFEGFSISSSLRSAVIALGKTISIETAALGINVNSISQGYVDTERVRNIAEMNARAKKVTVEESMKNMVESIPMKRMASPDEIGKLVAFLCSPDSSYITGTNIQIDGGIINYPF